MNINEKLNAVHKSIEDAIQESGRKAGSVKLLAVSKTKPHTLIQQVYDCGQRHFGENKVQELAAKAPVLASDIKWHHIGHLQSNKVKTAVQFSHLIHAVDSLKLANRINRLAAESGKVQALLLQANISGEESKYGLSLEQLPDVLEAVLDMPNLECQGFMTMSPATVDSTERLAIFKAMTAFRDNAQKQYNISLPELSMGMSSDYREAIEAGATIIRIGTSIFGARDYV